MLHSFTTGSYNRGMRRLLQFGSFMLILVALLTPLSAYFDQWDPPSLGDDTEMTVFALVLVLCLLLLVCRLVALFSVPITLLLRSGHARDQAASTWNRMVLPVIFIPPQSPSPLRI